VIRRLLFSFPIAALATGLYAQAPSVPQVSPSISAEHSGTSLRTGETILTGHPRIDYGDVRITADELRWNSTTQIVTAIGHAVLTRGPRRLVAEQITYHAADGTFEVGALRVGEYPVYMEGSSATGDRNAIRVNDARVTLPEPGLLVPTLHAARIFFGANHQIHAEQASLGLGPIRPVAIHGFRHNARSPLVSYVTAAVGYRRRLGAYIEGGLHIPITDVLRLGADGGLYSARGVMIGPSGTYLSPNGGDDLKGSFHSGFIHDYGTRFSDVLGRPVPHFRSFIEWNHQQQLTDRINITGELNYWRDSEVVRDFRPAEFFRVQEPDSFLESAYTGDNYLVSVFARAQPNSFQNVQTRLPEVRFDLLPIALGGNFYERFNASVAVLRDNPPKVGPTLKSTRADAYYSLYRPIRPNDWLTFTPVAGGRLTHYSDLDGPRSTYTRTLGEIGFDAEMRASGVYEYKNAQWKIDGLRHLMTPRLSYRYIPEAEKGARYIPPIDRENFSTYLQPLGLGETRNIDVLHGVNTLRFGIDNTLQTRDPVYGSRDLVVLNVANDFRFDRQPGDRKVSEIHTELGIMPARWLELSVYQSFSPQDLRLHEFNTGITLRDGDEWVTRFSSNFLRGELNDYLLESSHRLTEAFEAIVLLRYDARKQRFNEQLYGFRQNIGNTWRIQYAITIYGGQRRESGVGFNVQLQALRF
jgi:LPS-assembly protein